MPFDPASAKPKEAGFDPGSAQPKVSSATASRSGYLTDPVEDEKAYLEAKRMYESRAQFPGSQIAERFADSFGFNLTRPATGVVYWARGKGIPIPGFQGEGYEFGKAVDRYYDDMVRSGAGPVAAGTAEIAGTLASPSPIGKLKRGSALVRGGAKVAEEGGIAALEQQNLKTQNEQRDMLTDFLTGSLLSGGTRAIGGGQVLRHFPHLNPNAVGPIAQAAARGGARVLPTETDLSGAPTAEELKRYYLQQMLQDK